MGHARVSDLIQSLIQVLKDLDCVNKMAQVSMDVPNVKQALLDNLSIHRKEVDANATDLVNMGSCGLHIFDGSFSAASKKTDQNLEGLLKSFYKNFKEAAKTPKMQRNLFCF